MKQWKKTYTRRGLARGFAVVLSVMLTAVLLTIVFLYAFTPAKPAAGSDADLYARFQMHTSNRVRDAVVGIASIKKQYWISRDALSAPKPNPDCFGEAEEPVQMADVLAKASALLEGQELFFTVDTKILPGSTVKYYLDDTIFAVVWKEVRDYGVYTFSEVKIAHPSQFRRFLAGGEFGANQKYLTTEMAQSVNSVVASSGDFYLFRFSGIVVHDGTVRRVHNGVVDTCYIDDEGDLHITGVWDYLDKEDAQQYVDENHIQFSLAFGPALVRDGKVCTTLDYKMGEVNDYYPRAALGQLGKLHYLLAVVNSEGRYTQTPTIHAFAKQMQSTGCPIAYALDGGQTAVLTMNGEMVNSVMYGYQRKISDIIYFGTAIPYGQ